MDLHFKKLLKNIKLTDPQKIDAKTKVKSVSEALHAKYYPDQKYDGSTKLLIGSYGKHTHIRPPKDIDLLFKMPDAEFDRIDALAGNKQSQLLQEVREVLKDKFSTTEQIRAFGKVIVINFSEGNHTVELLPAWKLDSDKYRIPNSENGGLWDDWNPVAEIKNIDASSVATNRTRSLIRMIKCWTRVCSVPLKSFWIEMLVVNYLKECFNNQVGVDYPQLILGFFDYLKKQKNSSVFSPASGSFVNLGEDWFSRTESAHSRAEKAIAYEKDGKLKDASLEWQKTFGSDFPLAQEKSATEDLDTKIAVLMRRYPSADEENITDTYGYPLQLVPEYRLEIDAEVTKQKGFRAGRLSDFLAKHLPLLKGNQLKFSIRNSSIPTPYDVMWKVRNFGDEAQKAGGLRGKITRDEGYHQKKEKTAYYGEHYVECYSIQNNVCVAVGKILVPIGNKYE